MNKSIGAILVVVIALLVVARFGFQYLTPGHPVGTSPKVSSGDERRSELRNAINAAMQAKNFPAAEQNALTYIKENPGNLVGNVLLGDVYHSEGKEKLAIAQYEPVIANPKILDDSPTIPTRYGELCWKFGQLSEARKAYELVVREGASPGIGLPFVPSSSDAHSLQELRAEALCVDARNKGAALRFYLAETSQAIGLGPKLAYVCFVRADALYAGGMLADSRKFFDKAVQLAPVGSRKSMEDYISKTYGFWKWDVATKAIGPDGKAIVIYKKGKLPDFLPSNGYSLDGSGRLHRNGSTQKR